MGVSYHRHYAVCTLNKTIKVIFSKKTISNYSSINLSIYLPRCSPALDDFVCLLVSLEILYIAPALRHAFIQLLAITKIK